MASEIEAKIERVTANQELDEKVRTRIIEALQGTLEALKSVQDWTKKAEGFERDIQGAPELLKTLKKDLEANREDLKPEVPKDASVTQLEQLGAQAEADLTAARQQAEELDEEPKRRATRRQDLPGVISAARARADEIAKQLSTKASDESPGLTEARQLLLRTRKVAIEKELLSHELEARSYESRSELLSVRREVANRHRVNTEKLAKAWRELVNERRKLEAEQAAQDAREVSESVQAIHPLIQRLATRNTELAELRTGPKGMAARIEAITAGAARLDGTLKKLQEDFEGLKRRVEAAGLTEAIAVLLRRHKDNLPSLDRSLGNMRARRREISRAQLTLIELEDERAKLQDLSASVDATLASLSPAPDENARRELETTAHEILETRRKLLDSLTNDHNAYFIGLVDVDALERQLIEAITRYGEYINKHILWVRSAPLLRPSEIVNSLTVLRWYLDRTNLEALVDTCFGEAEGNPLRGLLAVLVLIFLFGVQRQLRGKLYSIGLRAAASYTEPYHLSVWALFITLLMAMPIPAFLWVLAWWCGSPEAPEYPRSLAGGLYACSYALFSLNALRMLCRPMGLGDAHFRWRAKTLQVLRTHLLTVALLALPLIFITFSLEVQTNDDWRDSAGRVSLILLLLAISAFWQRVLSPGCGVLDDLSGGREPTQMSRRVFRVWQLVAVGGPILLVAISAVGYHYTALQLVKQLSATLLLITSLVVVNATATRWLYHARALLAIEHTRQKREAAEQASPGTDAAAGSAVTGTTAPGRDLGAINVQTRNVLTAAILMASLLGLWLIWESVLPAFGIFERVEFWQRTVQVAETVADADGVERLQKIEKVMPITLADLLFAALIVLLTTFGSRNIPGILEIAVLRHLPFDAGGRYAICTLSQYGITVVGVLFALDVIGFGWSEVQWLVAAMSVGLGFGLQEIFANFVSGLILFLERPIRIGDTVTIGDVNGTVSRIRIRATTITDWDRKELVVPNKEFITGKLVNWTLTDNLLRMVIPVGVAYGSDTTLARQILLDVAANTPAVLKEPEPKSWFESFGDSSLNLSLRCYVPNIDLFLSTRHDLLTAIDAAFKKADIEISFPQRDLHLRASDEALRVVVEKT